MKRKKYLYVKIEISKDEHRDLKSAADLVGTSFQAYLGMILRRYVNEVSRPKLAKALNSYL